MKKTILTVFVLFSCTILLNSANAADDFRSAVDKAAKDFAEFTASKNDAKLGAMYAEDAMAFPPNSDMVKGRQAIQAFWKGFMDAGMKATLEVVDTETDGNLGVEVGKYTILDASGKTLDQGKYVVTWKKGNDGWKLYRDIWNTSMPAAPAK
jgi:ketosteroid isomerase-like protein